MGLEMDCTLSLMIMCEDDYLKIGFRWRLTHGNTAVYRIIGNSATPGYVECINEYNDFVFDMHVRSYLGRFMTGDYTPVDADVKSSVMKTFSVGLSVDYPNFVGLLYVQVAAPEDATKEEVGLLAKQKLFETAYVCRIVKL
jgi:hypothetical protein